MKYKLQDLIDMEHFQNLQDRLNEIYSFPSSIIDNDGNILTATAWQDICTQFHRKNKDCEKLCIESDQYIKDHIHEANPAVSYRCPHGLVDNATPIIIDDIHYGNFFTGQFFLEEPDMEFFRAQAKKYGFGEDAYLKAVKRVPIWTQEQLNNYLFFIKGLITVISESGLKKLKEMDNRKLIEASAKRHRSILKSAMDGYWLTDTKGRLIEVNDAYCHMSGYSEDELLAMRIPDLEALEDSQLVAERMQKIIFQGSDRFESKHRRKDGTVFDVEVSIRFRSEEDGQCVCFLRDITERNKAEEALRQSEKDLKASQRIAHLGSWHLDLATNRVEWTEELYNMYGFDPTLPPPPYTEHMKLFTPESWGKLSAALARTRETGTPYELELETVRQDGTSGWMWVRGERENDSAGKTIGLWGAAQDITERKRAEKEKEDLEGALRQALKMEAVGRLAGGVSHDFNNMLSVIIGHAEMAMQGVDPAQPLYANLEEIKNAGERSADLTRQLLAFARKQTVAPKVLDLNKTVGGMTRMLQRLIGEDIDLSLLPDEKLWLVKMDPSQIDQILANLCVNARDAITDVGKITIETGNAVFDETYCNDHVGFLPGEYVLLAVSDNGCGMDTETIGNIFEPFFTTKESGKGTGLGLATVYGVIKQNNGFINVYSEPGQGTTFRIYLPRHLTKMVDLSEKMVNPPPGRGHETILLVEDEPAILRMTTMMLERLGYTVVAARTPGEAISLAHKYTGKIDLLVTDVVMPEMNGRDLAKNILSFYPSLKRLFMSGYTANVIAHHGVLDEGVNFIQKPFSRGNIGAKIREVLDKDKD